MLDAGMSNDDIRLLLKNDGEFFIEFFLGDELTLPVPDLHKEIWPQLIDVEKTRVLLAIPRDHAKTTLSKLAVVWYFVFTDYRFCVYLSNTNAISLRACQDIMGFMRSDNFVRVFGNIEIETESQTASLWIFNLRMANGRVKRCILRAVGANQQMRGINIDNQRPDLAIVDDVEDLDNTESQAMQKKLDLWIFGPFLKALARNRRKIIWLGNMLKDTSLLARLSRNPDWNPVVFGCLIKDPETGKMVSLWEDRWPLEELVKDFIEYQSLGLVETWMCEMMNMPGHGKNGFSKEHVYYQPVPLPDEVQCAFLCLDPAFGENQHNDNSAITVHVIREDGLPMVAEDWIGRADEAELYRHMVRLANKWNAWVWGIEAVAAQKVLITLFRLYASLELIDGQIQMIPLLAGRGDPKVARISAWATTMKERQYAIYEGAVTITTQLLSYNMLKKSNDDDGIDSAAYGPQMIDNYLGLIKHAAKGLGPNQWPKLQTGMEVCDV